MTERRTATLIALTATAVLCSTGGAVAGSMITGAQIKDGTVASRDVKNRSLVAKDLTGATVKSFSRPGPKGAPGLVRAYGRVASDGTVTQKSAGVTVTRPEPGIYCISAPGVSRATTVAVVTPDFEYGATGVGTNPAQSFAEFGGGDLSCPASALSVRTFVRFYNTDGTGDLVGTTMQVQNQPFTFLVP